MAKTKPVLYYTLKGVCSDIRYLSPMAVTSEKTGNLFGRDLDSGMGTHCRRSDARFKFRTEDDVRNALKAVAIARQANQRGIDLARQTLNQADLAQRTAMEQAAAPYVYFPARDGVLSGADVAMARED